MATVLLAVIFIAYIGLGIPDSYPAAEHKALGQKSHGHRPVRDPRGDTADYVQAANGGDICGARDVCCDDDINCVFHTQTGR